MTHVTSWQNDNGTGTIRNQVEYTHHPDYGNLLITEQSHEGAATGVPYVIYVPDLAVDGEDRFVNAMRQKQTIYPNNRIIHQTYGAANSIADRLSRVDMLEEDSSGNPGTDLTAYGYSGVGRLATADDVPIKVKLDLYQGTTNGTYAGFDRFGRVKEHLWDDYDTGSPPNIAQVKYGYNEVGNRTWREDVMAAANGEDHDEFYTHDGLHRLKTFDRGNLTGSPYSGISGTPSREEDYVLQQSGNWQSYTIKENGSTTLSQIRSHNTANEIHTIITTSWVDPTHDAAGNMTTMPQPKDPLFAGGYTATYDAWNRLVSLSDSNGTVQTNEYDGLHRRIIRDETGGSGVLTHFYWNESWQCVEERIGASSSPHKQYVWHPYYIDALAVSYDSSSNKHYYTHDANMNVTAALNSSGVVVERYQYSPYGEMTILEADFDVAGSQVSSIGNEFLYTGRRLDPESGLYQFRHRYYHAQLGRFVNRDPIGYLGGMNLYGYVRGMPTYYVDPYGLDPHVDDWNLFPPNEEGEISVAGAFLGELGFQIGNAVADEIPYAGSAKGFSELTTGKDVRGDDIGVTGRAFGALNMVPGGGTAGKAIKGTAAAGKGIAKGVWSGGKWVVGKVGKWFKRADDTAPCPPPKRKLTDPLPANPKKPSQADPHAPDPDATGPHTVIGTRTNPKKSPEPYREAITYDEFGDPVGMTHLSDHGRPWDHENPHYHPFDPEAPSKWNPGEGNFGDGEPLPDWSIYD